MNTKDALIVTDLDQELASGLPPVVSVENHPKRDEVRETSPLPSGEYVGSPFAVDAGSRESLLREEVQDSQAQLPSMPGLSSECAPVKLRYKFIDPRDSVFTPGNILRYLSA